MTGREYKAERKRLGFSQDELAERLKTSRSTIVRLENAECVPRASEYALRWLGYTLAGGAREAVAI